MSGEGRPRRRPRFNASCKSAEWNWQQAIVRCSGSLAHTVNSCSKVHNGNWRYDEGASELAMLVRMFHG